MQACIFCSIIKESNPATIIAQTDNLVVIKDIVPKASVHYLIIPKKHIADLKTFSSEDQVLAGDLLMMAQQLAIKLPSPQDFRIIMNNGAGAGQCVFHVHLHFLAGKKIPSF